MDKPKDYSGPMMFAIPPGYIDVTSHTDTERKGIAGLDHPYYVLQGKINKVLELHSGCYRSYIVDKIMEIL